jgi:hypothetical protein
VVEAVNQAPVNWSHGKQNRKEKIACKRESKKEYKRKQHLFYDQSLKSNFRTLDRVKMPPKVTD